MKVGELTRQLSDEHPDWCNKRIADEVRQQIPGAKTTPASVASTLSNSRSGRWPEWPEPRESTQVDVAQSVMPLVRFLHPDVIATVDDDAVWNPDAFDWAQPVGLNARSTTSWSFVASALPN